MIKKNISLLNLMRGFALPFLIIFFSTNSAFAQTELQGAMEWILNNGPAKLLDTEGHGYSSAQIDKILTDLYQKRDLKPAWVTKDGPDNRAGILLSVLDSASSEGLDPASYQVSLLHKWWDKRDVESLAKLDILLTLELASYVGDVREGRIIPKSVEPKLFATAHDVDIDVVALTKQALEAPDLLAFLKAQPPQHRYYRALISALAHYRKIQQNGGWPSIPAGKTLEIGTNDPRVTNMRKRLSITGEYTGAAPVATIYDKELEQAVKLFQEQHYLTPDGKAGKATIAAMNVSAEDRAKQIIINLERWRWTSRDMEGTQIFINIAAFHLSGLTDENIDIRMPVIVGSDYHMTPVFSDSIKYLEFNPYWNIPASIAENEYLPQLQKNLNALSAKHIRIFSKDEVEIDPNSVDWKNVSKKEMARYRLRQDPGPWNALGTVKFIFPNPYSVYLHDTPNHAPFSQQDRAMSHGCIRLSQPHELAAYVLGKGDNSWTLERVIQVVAAKERKVVRLNKPMPVHILYRTVVATPDGIVRFGGDVYGRDKLLAKALFN